MAPVPSRGLAARVFVVAALVSLTAAPAARALRLVDYNVTNYPGVLFTQRQPHFRTIFTPLNADILVSQEFTTQAGVDSFRANVLNAIEPGQWASAQFFNGNDTDNALFYKPAKVQVLGAWAFYPNPANLLRYVTVWRLKPVGYLSDGAEFRLYSQHLKASTGFEAQRLAECTGIRDSMNAMPAGTHAIVIGDFNFYNSSTEPGYFKLQEVQTNNIGRVLDPQNPGSVTQNWHNNAAFANVHSQCPCVTCPTGSGFSGGGLDDRFDQILPTLNFQTGQGLSILPSTYIVVGQDGQHFNLNITDPPTIPEGSAYASALWNASDHLPSRIDIQLPAQIGAVAAVSFGSAIVGGTVNQNAAVPDTAHAPADSLRFTASADPGFSTPAVPYAAPAGGSALVPVGLDTSMPGNKAGNLTIASNDLDYPSTLVALSGTVLAHAEASLDSLTSVLVDSIDFGAQTAGNFTAQDRRVHNRGYGALQARLSLDNAVFAGGDGRFSIVGGFSPILLSGTGQTYSIAFNDAGATPDSEYTATLTFSSTDEALPGAIAQPDLVIGLKAQLSSGTLGADPGPDLPAFTRLYPPSPNPLNGASLVRFDLARAVQARLEVFDLSGRRVSTLASRPFEPGRYSIRWDGHGTNGPLGPGLYFVRLSGAGLRTETARLAIVR